MKYKIEKTASQLRLTAPYNPDFISTAKSDLGAKWDGECWCFDVRDEVAALKLIERKYGWVADMPLVSVRITFDESRSYGRGPCILLGRIIAAATGRDSGAKLGDGVRLNAGDGADSGGSVKNWTTTIAVGSEFLVHDVPYQMALDYINGKRASRNVVVQLFSEIAPVEADTSQLKAERATLLARLAELDLILG